MLMELNNEKYAYTTCTQERDPDNYVCEGKIEWATPKDIPWKATFAYKCTTCEIPENPVLDLDYNITVHAHNTVECRPTSLVMNECESTERVSETRELLSSLYTSYSPINAWGLTTGDICNALHDLYVIQSSQCHRFLSESIMRRAVPQCTADGQPIYFCREVCENIYEACKHIPGVVPFYNRCFVFRSRSEGHCIDKNITCTNDPLPPINGYVNVTLRHLHSKAMFHCNSGYELVQNATTICDYTGRWRTDVTPECVTIRVNTDNNQTEMVIIWSVVSSVTVLLVLLICYFIYLKLKYNIIILFFKRCRWMLFCNRFVGKYEAKTYHTFLGYHDTDRSFVCFDLHQKLEEAGFMVFIDDLQIPGRLPIKYIPEAIARSHSAIIVLNQIFLNDSFCQFMLDQTFFQTLEEDSFKVIILHKGNLKDLKRTPKYLGGLIQSGCTTIKIPDKLLIDKIRYELRNLEVVVTNLQYLQQFSLVREAQRNV